MAAVGSVLGGASFVATGAESTPSISSVSAPDNDAMHQLTEKMKKLELENRRLISYRQFVRDLPEESVTRMIYKVDANDRPPGYLVDLVRDLLKQDPQHSPEDAGHFKRLQEELSRGMNLTSVLIAAAERGDLEHIKFLSGIKGVDLNAHNSESQYPLFAAARSDRLEVARYLLEHGAKPACNCVPTPLHFALFNDDIELVALLRQKGADASRGLLSLALNNVCSINDPFDWIPLYLKVARNTRIPLTLSDLQLVAAVNLALAKCHVKALRALFTGEVRTLAFINNKTTLDQNRTIYYETTLHGAVAKAKTDMAHLLLEMGADITIKDPVSGKTAYDIAFDNDNGEVVEAFILTKRIDINQPDSRHRTLLHYAAEKHKTSIAKVLIKHKIDVTVHSKGSRTAYDIARDQGDTVMMDIISPNLQFQENFQKERPHTLIGGLIAPYVAPPPFTANISDDEA